MNRVLKPKTCRACRDEFAPRTSMQVVCFSHICAQAYVQAKRHKAEQAETKAKLLAIKPRKEWLAKTQAEANRYARLRDIAAGYGCICCGKPFEPDKIGGSADGGHYLSVGSHPQLRLEADTNIFAQRKNCNRPGGTTHAAFRLGVIARIGLEAVEALESDQQVRKWTIPELIAMGAHFRKRGNEFAAQIKSRESMLKAA